MDILEIANYAIIWIILFMILDIKSELKKLKKDE